MKIYHIQMEKFHIIRNRAIIGDILLTAIGAPTGIFIVYTIYRNIDIKLIFIAGIISIFAFIYGIRKAVENTMRQFELYRMK